MKKNDKVIIYGAGKIGQLIFSLCQNRGIKVVRVWDNYPDKVLRFENKALITKPPSFTGNEKAEDYGLQNAIVIITVFAPDSAAKLARPLFGKGFGAIIYNRSEVSQLLVDHCQWLVEQEKFEFNLDNCFICPARRDEHIECDIFNVQQGMMYNDSSDFIVLPVLGFLLTTNCNLTCRGCNHLRDYFEKQDNINFNSDEILCDLNKLIDAIDFIKSLVIVGGEPFMHPKFDEILHHILSLPKIGFIQIITNGTVMPKKDVVYDLISNQRVMVEISGYGDQPGNPRIKKREKLFNKLHEYNVKYRYDETAQWFDFGGFEKRAFDIDGHKKMYETCCFISNDLLNGKLHKCSRSAYGLFLNKIPNYQSDYINIRDSNNKNALRIEVKKFLDMMPMACYHCNGTFGKIIPAGVQVVKTNDSVK